MALGIGALVAASLFGTAAGVYGANRSRQVSQENSRESRAWQERMSNTAHTREVKDLRTAGLNPILSAKSSGAPVGAGSTATTPDFSSAYGGAAMKSAQLALILSQARKTSAEATLVEDQKNRAGLESDFYGSIAGAPAIAAKSLGGAGTAYGTYRAAKAFKNMLSKRKSKAVLSRPKSLKSSKSSKRSNKFRRKSVKSPSVGGYPGIGRNSFRYRFFSRF